MGGPRVTPKSEALIIQIWMNLSKNDKEPSARQVLEAAKRHLAANKRDDIFLPQLRKVQDLLSTARDKHKGLPPREKKFQEPWSMATLNEYPLPSESLDAVMHAWRFALINGEPFTIRQAKWVSRLYVLPFLTDITKLLLASYEYAKREEAALISKNDFDTFNSDLRLVFTGIEYVTIWKNLHGEQQFPDPFYTSLPFANDGGVMHEVLHPVDYYNALYNNTISNERDKALHALIAKMPSFETLGLFSNEMRILYLIWVTHIKRQPEWQKITAKQAANIIKKLKDWSLKMQSIKYDPDKPPTETVAARIVDNKVFIDPEFPTPQSVLKLLSEYANKGGK